MSNTDVTLPTLDALLNGSNATDSFKAAVHAFAAERKPAGNHHIQFNAGAPPVKVLRVISQLLESQPGLAIDSVHVEGQSGCSDFRGTVAARTTDNSFKKFRFVWDCAWRAREQGWTTFFGDADQQKAAQVYGYRCFEVFEPLGL